MSSDNDLEDSGGLQASQAKRHYLSGIVATVAVLGAVDEAIQHSWSSLPTIVGFCLYAVVMALVFGWLGRDSASTEFRRSLRLNAGIIVLPAFFIPIYLYRSRAPGTRARALAVFGLFLMMLFTVYGVGVVLAGIFL